MSYGKLNKDGHLIVAECLSCGYYSVIHPDWGNLPKDDNKVEFLCDVCGYDSNTTEKMKDMLVHHFVKVTR